MSLHGLLWWCISLILEMLAQVRMCWVHAWCARMHGMHEGCRWT